MNYVCTGRSCFSLKRSFQEKPQMFDPSKSKANLQANLIRGWDATTNTKFFLNMVYLHLVNINVVSNHHHLNNNDFIIPLL